MTEYTQDPERQIPETTSGTGAPEASGLGDGGMGGYGQAGRVEQARSAAGGKLEETARRVRELGDRAAAKSPALASRARPLANNAADGIDSAARYVRERELDEMRGDLEAQVRRHPLASVAVAFLAGYALRRIF